MNKAELIEIVAVRLGHTKRDVTDIVEAFIEETKRAVSKGEKVALSGFGVFDVAHRKARSGRNPRTGETVKIKASKAPKFRAGAEFKAVVNGTKKVEAPAKKAAKKAPAKKAAAKKAPAKKAAAKKAPAKKAPAKKAAKKATRR